MSPAVPLDIEIILPSQFARSTVRTREQDLMAAVLELALNDLRTRRTHDGGRPIPRQWVGQDGRASGMSPVMSPRNYVLSTETWWPYAFENVCDVLGLDADGIRRALRRKGLL